MKYIEDRKKVREARFSMGDVEALIDDLMNYNDAWDKKEIVKGFRYTSSYSKNQYIQLNDRDMWIQSNDGNFTVEYSYIKDIKASDDHIHLICGFGSIEVYF